MANRDWPRRPRPRVAQLTEGRLGLLDQADGVGAGAEPLQPHPGLQQLGEGDPQRSPNRSNSSWLRRAASAAAVGVIATSSMALACSALASSGVGGRPSARATTAASR